MRVELLFAEDDPAYMAARQNLVEVLGEDAFETPIQMVAVADDADALLLGMPGSPTIRIDGDDIHPESALAPGRGRRAYPAEDGRATSPVPSKPLIRRAVARARGWGHERR
jgi:hypothetical protein